jgi:hypothetical protein
MARKATVRSSSTPTRNSPGAVETNGDRGFDLPSFDPSQVVRTTIVLPIETDLNLDLCRLKLGATRNELIKRAIHNFLVQEGFDPLRSPKNLGVSY